MQRGRRGECGENKKGEKCRTLLEWYLIIQRV